MGADGGGFLGKFLGSFRLCEEMFGFKALSFLGVPVSFLDAWIGELDGMEVLGGFPRYFLGLWFVFA